MLIRKKLTPPPFKALTKNPSMLPADIPAVVNSAAVKRYCDFPEILLAANASYEGAVPTKTGYWFSLVILFNTTCC